MADPSLRVLREAFRSLGGRDMSSVEDATQELIEELSVSLDELRAAQEELADAATRLTSERTQALESSDFYTAIFLGLPISCIVLDAAGVIRAANDEAAQLVGVERRFLVGKPLVLFTRRGLDVARLTRASRQQAPARIRVRARHGDTRDLQFDVRPLLMPPGGLLLTARSPVAEPERAAPLPPADDRAVLEACLADVRRLITVPYASMSLTRRIDSPGRAPGAGEILADAHNDLDTLVRKLRLWDWLRSSAFSAGKDEDAVDANVVLGDLERLVASFLPRDVEFHQAFQVTSRASVSPYLRDALGAIVASMGADMTEGVIELRASDVGDWLVVDLSATRHDTRPGISDAAPLLLQPVMARVRAWVRGEGGRLDGLGDPPLTAQLVIPTR